MKKSAILTSLAAFCLAFLMMPQTVHAAGFVQDATGIKYQNDDGSFLIDSWVQIGQNIYHLDANGNVQTGWIQVGNLWYFLDTNGVCTNPAGTATPPAELTAPVTPVPAVPTTAAPAAATSASDASKMFSAAGWVPFQTADATLLSNGIAAGLIGTDGAQYWAEPTFAASAQALIAQASPAPVTSVSNTPSITDQVVPASETTVYITNTGIRYHRAGCRYLDESQYTISLSNAISQKYTPCKVCKPPVK